MSLDVWVSLVILFIAGGLTPGPAVIFIMGASFQYGFRAAMQAALGIASANILWIVLAAFGVGSFAAIFPNMFFVIKLVGFAVLVYFAVAMMKAPLLDAPVADTSFTSRHLYGKATALQISSPMPLLYFGLILPLYFETSRPLLIQIFIMIVTVTVTELVGLSLYAYGAQKIRMWLKNRRAARMFNISTGCLMLGLGLWAMVMTA